MVLIIHKSVVISMDVLFNGLLSELPTILDSFTNNTSACIRVIGQGWWGATIEVG